MAGIEAGEVRELAAAEAVQVQGRLGGEARGGMETPGEEEEVPDCKRVTKARSLPAYS